MIHYGGGEYKREATDNDHSPFDQRDQDRYNLPRLRKGGHE